MSDFESHRAALRGLYVLTDERLGGGHLAIGRAALEAGARILQLRDKTTPPRDLLPIALELRELTRQAGAILLVNDQIDLALFCQADGVHLGPDDWPPHAARAVLGAQKIIGVSCGTPREAQNAWQEGADYIGAGAIFATQTKNDAGAPIGLDALEAIVAATPLPVAAIGGLNAENLASTLRAGAQMACVVSALCQASDLVAAGRKLVALVASAP